MQPSPLDAPRFVDDPTLSEWSTKAGDPKRFVAPVESVQKLVQPILHKHHQRWPRPVPKNTQEAGPIHIELVRGAVGVDNDAWRMTVDGVRCDPMPVKDNGLVDKPKKDGDTPTCTLPPPFHDGPDASLWNVGAVRPLLISARLEDEAMSPEKIEIVVEQVTCSRQRRVEDPDGQCQVVELERINVQPYTLQDSVGEAVGLAYPFNAPAQSSLVFWVEESVEKTLTSEFKELKNINDKVTNLEEKLNQATDELKKAQGDDQKTTIRKNIEKLGKQIANNLKKIPIPGQANIPKTLGDPSIVEDLIVSCIGGDKNSMMHDLTAVLRRINEFCKSDAFARRDTRKKSGKETVEDVLKFLRNSLKQAPRRDTIAAAFLTSLLKSESIIQVGDDLIDEVIDVCEKKSPPKENAAINTALEGNGNNKTLFAYDAVSFAYRTLTTTRIRYVLEVTEFGYDADAKPTTRFILESIRDHGFAAYASYARAVEEIKELRVEIQKFKNKFENSVDTTVTVASTDGGETVYIKPEMVKFFKLLNEILIVSYSALPQWPPVLPDTELYSDGVVEDTPVLTDDDELQDQRMEIERRLPLFVKVSEKAVSKATFDVQQDMLNADAPTLRAVKSLWRWVVAGILGLSVFLFFNEIFLAFLPTLTFATTASGLFKTLSDTFKSFWSGDRFSALAGLIEGLSADAVNTFDQALRWRGYAYRKFAQAYYTISNYAIQRSLEGLKNDKKRRYYWKKALQYATDNINAVRSSVAAARLVSDNIEQHEERIGLMSVTRTYFVEHYYLNDDSGLEAFTEFDKTPYSNDQWYLVPDSNSLTLLPPADVVDALYETSSLRRIPVDAVVRRVVGTSGGVRDAQGQNVAATSPMEVAARSAHAELMNNIRGVRSAQLTGENLMHSAGQVGLELAKNGARIIKTLYDTRVNGHFVLGDDILWSCMTGGVAARLALRHVSLFVRAQLDLSQQPAAESPNPAYRRLMQEFADAWVAQAVQVARSEAQNIPHVVDKEVMAVEAVRSFERVKSLLFDDKDSKSNSLYVVASAFAPLLRTSGYPTDTGNAPMFAPGVEEHIRRHVGAAKRFEDQKITKPSMLRQTKQRIASWASRRIDSLPMRSWRPTSGVENLVDSLAGIKIENGNGRTQDSSALKSVRNYYCPMGSHVESLPGRAPFATESLGNRLVWLNDLRRAAQNVRRHVTTSPDDDDESHATVLTNFIPDVGKSIENVRGLQRHPLTVSALSNKTARVFLSQSGIVVEEAIAQPDALLGAVQDLDRDHRIGRNVERRVANMRTAAFNADRLHHALNLINAAADEERVNVFVPDARVAVALIIAVSLQLKDEATSTAQQVFAYVPDPEVAASVVAVATELEQRSEAALEKSCKAVTFAEACATLV